jgi:glycosyltransferase involved in cell wall biosynthesis
MELLSVVVPVYEEVDTLSAFHDELLATIDELETPAEIIYVDDGSADGSTEELEAFHRARPEQVRVVVLRRNFGKSGALAAGFADACGDVVATIDGDGQDVPGELPKLVATLEESGSDLVVGWRRDRHDRRVKRWTSRCYNAATRALTGLPVHDFNTGFKVLRREVADELDLYGEFHRFVPVLAHDLGFRVTEIDVSHRPREAGASKYLSLLRFPKTLLDLLTVVFLTRFADRPLYLFGGVGAALSAAGFGILVYLSWLRLVLKQGIGERPLLLLGVLALLVGVQLVGTGFIGDVLRHSVSRDKRAYRVRRRHEVPSTASQALPSEGDRAEPTTPSLERDAEPTDGPGGREVPGDAETPPERVASKSAGEDRGEERQAAASGRRRGPQ